MKFIKTTDGNYINPIHVDVHTLADYEVDPKSTPQFDPKAEAQAWLDNLVAELSKED